MVFFWLVLPLGSLVLCGVASSVVSDAVAGAKATRSLVAPADCTPPYTIDDAGARHFKPQCL